ncbi:hypothetical protein R3P38DRAFT_2870609 [Favolaschia claudopus]|uniref:Uncharacterized protein n=1 Tax=Favolaschia claudopus TaxID=2862362 RepID=A0AAW0DC09_9AGAR
MASAMPMTEPATINTAEPMPAGTTMARGEAGEPQSSAVAQTEGQPPMVPFKERVIGVAKKTRGTLLGKPELKEHGEKILQGEASIHNVEEPPTM